MAERDGRSVKTKYVLRLGRRRKVRPFPLDHVLASFGSCPSVAPRFTLRWVCPSVDPGPTGVVKSHETHPFPTRTHYNVCAVGVRRSRVCAPGDGRREDTTVQLVLLVVGKCAPLAFSATNVSRPLDAFGRRANNLYSLLGYESFYRSSSPCPEK